MVKYKNPQTGAWDTAFDAEWIEEIFGKIGELPTKEWTLEQIADATGEKPTGEDLMPQRTTSFSKNGVTFTPNGEGGYSIAGTATANAACIIHKNSMPEGITVGKTYTLEANTVYGVIVDIIAISSTGEKEIAIVETNTASEFTVPQDTATLYIQILVRSGQTIDMVLTPHIYEKTTLSYPKPILTIIDDDGYEKFNTLLMPIVQEKKVPIASAIIGANVDQQSYAMNLETIKNCALNGAEILSHTWSHLTESGVADLEQYEIQYDYQKMYNYLKANGVESKGLVFCGNSSTLEKCLNAGKIVHEYGFVAGGDETNQKYTTSRFGITRYSISPDTTLTTANLQSLLDELAEAGTGWMIWMLHTSSIEFQQAQADIISEMIDYARSLGIEIVTTSYGVKQYVVD